MTIIYLDHASATRPLELKGELFWQSLASPYAPKEAHAQYKSALEAIRAELGYTDRDGLALTGDGNEALRRLASIHYDLICQSGKGHIVHLGATPLKEMLTSDACSYISLPILSDQQLTPSFLEPYLTPRVSLLTLPLANPVTGVIHPIWDIGELCRKKGVLLHLDITHCIGKISTRLDELPADYLTAEGRLIGAPFDCGFLLARNHPLNETPHYARTIALAQALSAASARFEKVNLETTRLKYRFEEALQESVIASNMERLPTTTAIHFEGIHNELLLFHLVQKGVIASLGEGKSTLSFTLSSDTTQKEIDRAAALILETARLLRSYSLSPVAASDGIIPWALFPDRLVDRVLRPKAAGFFSPDQSGMFLAVGEEEGIRIELLVDSSDGIIADAKFSAFAPPALIAAADVACEIILRKTYLQASRLSADLIEGKLPFPPEAATLINRVLFAVEKASLSCSSIPLTEEYVESPIEMQLGEGESYPDWENLSDGQRVGLIQAVIAKDIQPYVEMDAGGVEVKEVQGNKVIIAYSGTCTTCYSSVGSTLQAIQGILRGKLNPLLEVVPDSSLFGVAVDKVDLY